MLVDVPDVRLTTEERQPTAAFPLHDRQQRSLWSPAARRQTSSKSCARASSFKVEEAKAVREMEKFEANDDGAKAEAASGTLMKLSPGHGGSLTKEKVRMPSHGYSRLSSFAGLQIKEVLQQAAVKEKELLALLQLTSIQIWKC